MVCKCTFPRKGAPFASDPASTCVLLPVHLSLFPHFLAADLKLAQASGISPTFSTTRISEWANGPQKMMGRLGADGQCSSYFLKSNNGALFGPWKSRTYDVFSTPPYCAFRDTPQYKVQQQYARTRLPKVWTDRPVGSRQHIKLGAERNKEE